MNGRGQSALEYLMTYGWALIVIAIVVGVLIVISGTSTGGIVCKSQSNDLVLQTASVSGARVQLSLQNASGVTMSTLSAADGGDFTPITDFSVSPSSSVNSGLSFVVDSNANDGPGTLGRFTNGIVTVSYTKTGLPAATTATIVCSGTL